MHMTPVLREGQTQPGSAQAQGGGQTMSALNLGLPPRQAWLPAQLSPHNGQPLGLSIHSSAYHRTSQRLPCSWRGHGLLLTPLPTPPSPGGARGLAVRREPLTRSVTPGKPPALSVSQLFHPLNKDDDLCLQNLLEETGWGFFFSIKIKNFFSFENNFRPTKKVVKTVQNIPIHPSSRFSKCQPLL